MKTLIAFCVLLMIACFSSAQAAWQYHLPSTGLLPSAACCSFVGSAGERHHGEGALSLQSVELTVPFSDPRRSYIDDWYLNACLDMEFTHITDARALGLEASHLYAFTLPLSAIHPMKNGRRLLLTVAPHLATDFNGSGHAFGLGGYAVYRFHNTKNLEASAGFACMPNETAWWFVPLAIFDWKPAPDWCVSMKGYRLQVMRELSDGLSAGAFMRGIGGSWASHNADGTHLLRVRSVATGARAEWDFSRKGQTKRILFADIGVSFFTEAEKLRFADKRHSTEIHHYHPAPFLSFGADFRF